MLALKISMILLLVVLGGVLIWLLFGLLIGPLVLKGIFDADLDNINEKRKHEECVKMDFDKWYDIYCLNTKKWGLSCLPHCRIGKHNYKNGDVVVLSKYWDLDSFCTKDIYVDFGFIGNLKYSLWRHKYLKSKETREIQEREVKNLKSILESAQEDIEILKKQSEEEMKKAAETSAKVKENLDKELCWHHNVIKGQDNIAPVKMKTGYDNDPPMFSIFGNDKVDF